MFQSFSRLKWEELCLLLKPGRNTLYDTLCNKNDNPALGKRGRGNSWKILGEILCAATRTRELRLWWPSSRGPFFDRQNISRSFSFNFLQLPCAISISARDLSFFISFFLSYGNEQLPTRSLDETRYVATDHRSINGRRREERPWRVGRGSVGKAVLQLWEANKQD